jgi:TrmH family RNA methyltransferase
MTILLNNRMAAVRLLVAGQAEVAAIVLFRLLFRHMTNQEPGSLKPIKWYKDLATREGRFESGAFLVEGARAISQVVSNHPAEVMEILFTVELPPLYQKFAGRRVTEGQLGSICSSKTPQGTAAVVRMPQEIYSGSLPGRPGNRILLLEDIQDPGNVGTLIRTAVAFGFSGVILTEKCADPLSPKCVQSTAGTVLSLWIRRTPDYLELVKALRRDGYKLVAADLEGDDDPSILQGQKKLLLALGNEASGLSAAVLRAADGRIKIPIYRNQAESLNVAACGAICMYLSSAK